MTRRRDPATGRFVKAPAPLVSMPAEKVKELAIRVVHGDVWVAWTAEDLENSFGMLLMLAQSHIVPPNVTTMYASVRDALPYAVNGQPQFMAGQFLTGEDFTALVVEVQRMEAALRA